MSSTFLRAAAGLAALGLCLSLSGPAPLTSGPAVAQTAQPTPLNKLAIERIQIIEAPAKGYRDPALKQTASVGAASDMHIYVEPTGLATKFENGEVKALMVLDLQLKNTAGKVIRDGKGLMRVPVAVKAQSLVPLKDVYVNVKLDPLKLPPGPYVLLIRINDEFGRTSTEKTLGFTQTAGGTAPPAKK
ncbi:MAG: hypothetical protein ACKVP7_27855 [Hyphomicrobiaceae bacterium]